MITKRKNYSSQVDKKICFFTHHRYLPHFTGNKIQIGADAPVGKEVDYYFCERCWEKDPERSEYSEKERQQLAKFYIN